MNNNLTPFIIITLQFLQVTYTNHATYC